jgi:hypothetical protein
MKIVQTLWLPDADEHPVRARCGWASPEYHWMSWVLSAMQLQKYYDTLELYTTERGYYVLVECLKLPYDKVHMISHADTIPPSAWALAKIMTYGLQDKPFLHVDGDVFTFAAFPPHLLSAPLITQSKEIDFFHYRETLDKVRSSFKYLPPLFLEHDQAQAVTFNAGIFGGSDIDFIKKYASAATSFVLANQEHFQNNDNPTAYCMLFEQWLYSCLVNQCGKAVDTLLQEPVSDPGYPGLADFYAPQQHYVHLMGMSKKNRFVLKQLMSKLRQSYPHAYYDVLRLCKSNKVTLDFKVYEQKELDPLILSTETYLDIISNMSFDENAGMDDGKWKHYYAKDQMIFNQVEGFNNLDDHQKNIILFFVLRDFEVREVTTPELKHLLLIHDTFNLQREEMELEPFEVVMIELLKETEHTLPTLLASLAPFFDAEDFAQNADILRKLLEQKLMGLMQRGVIFWKYQETYSMQTEADLQNGKTNSWSS